MDHRVSSTDPLGNVFATPYDTAGRLAMEVNPNTYDPATRSGPQGIRYEYDTDDRRIKVIYPDGGIRRLKYDAMGNLVKVIEPEQYDAETDDGPGYVYRYDAAGRLGGNCQPGQGRRETLCLRSAGPGGPRDLPQRAIWPGNRRGPDRDVYAYNRAGWLLEEKREPVSRAEDGSVQYRLTQSCLRYQRQPDGGETLPVLPGRRECQRQHPHADLWV